MRSDRPHICFDDPNAAPDPGYRRVRVTEKGNGYMGRNVGSMIDLYHTQAAIAFADGFVVYADEPEKKAARSKGKKCRTKSKK